MPKVEVTTILAGTEFLVSALALFIFYLRGWHKYYKAMSVYLTFRFLSGVVVTPLILQQIQQSTTEKNSLSLSVFWINYLISAVMVFAVYAGILKSAFAALPKQAHFGRVGLLWMLSFFGVLFLVLSIEGMGSGQLLASELNSFTHAMCVLELCMLAFLLIGLKALRISVKDVSFGIALGFAVLAITNLLHSVNGLRDYFGMARLQYVYQLVSIVALVIWSAYAAQPVKRREPVLLPLRTMLHRWNEIASAMGHKETKVLRPRQASFFLKDVEKIVDRAFEENFK
jgi:hypothetical protein